MSDLTHYLVRHADGTYLVNFMGMRSFVSRVGADRYDSLTDARSDAKEYGGTVVRVTVRRVKRATEGGGR